MASIGRKDKIPLRQGVPERARATRPDPRLGMAVTPWGMARALAARCPVVLGGEYPLVLAGLRAVLGGDPALRVTEEIGNSVDALRGTTMPGGVLVVACDRWSRSHAEALAGLRTRAPGVRVVLLTDEPDGERLHQFLMGGGRGVLKLTAPVADVQEAVHAARPPLSADWAEPEAGLSEREAMVLRHKVNGYANKAIAADLGLSVKTVETYYTRGMEKLGLKSRVEMLQYGVAQGWISSAG